VTLTPRGYICFLAVKKICFGRKKILGKQFKKIGSQSALAPKIFEKLDWGRRRAGGAPEDIRDELSSH